MRKTFLLVTLITTIVGQLNGQVSFSNIDCELRAEKKNNQTEIICSNSTMSIKFEVDENVKIMAQKNFAIVDSQIIQVTPLQVSGNPKILSTLNVDEQREFLENYSKYELDYMKSDLGVKIINSDNQWVTSKSRKWFIWYFRIGNSAGGFEKKTEIQLFASTIFGSKVLTLNAPIMTGGDFAKAALIINEMMETFVDDTKN